MRILTKDQYVDFEAPIQMTGEQEKKFLAFMKEEFIDVETEEVEEKSKEMGERTITSKDWTPDEFSLLLSPETNEELSAKTDRSIMSIKMMRGHFVPEFMVWARKKGYSLPVKMEVIEKFLKEGKK
jgi:hypothetical protein|tara:strand:+ start:2343 stop:2720 length:378 start_codon:yes stop_codon:yes gene_type:complete